MKTETFHCDYGNHDVTVEKSGFTVGYGVNGKGEKSCYACCAQQDREYMDREGKDTLYFSNGEVTNWPGSLRYPVTYQKTSRHNWGLKRTDFWFKDYQGKNWHGYHIGHNSEICYVRRLKK